MASERSCLKTGCFGCLAIFVLFLIFGAVSTALSFRSSARSDPKVEELSHRLPEAPTDRSTLEDEANATAAPDGAIELPEGIPGVSLQEPLVIDLDFSMGSFIIEPGEVGEDLRVVADYDASDYELSEEFDPEAGRYKLRFRRKGVFFGFVHRGGDAENEIRLRIPPGHPVALEGEIGIGESRVDLGGLQVESVNLTVGVGDHRFEVSRPTTVPMDLFELDSSIGELEIEELGNASPRQVRLNHSVGEIDIDLNGAWRNDSDIEIRCGIGECSLKVPSDVRVDLDRARMSIGERSVDLENRDDLEGPTLHISVEGTIGELRVRD